MKKAFIIFFVLMAATGLMFAQSINLGDFPVGKWADPNYDALWDFSTGNIKILSLDGKTVHCDFSQKTVNDFKVGLSAGGPTITFSCPETGRSYKFTKPLNNSDITLEIDRTNKPHYSVVMKKQ